MKIFLVICIVAIVIAGFYYLVKSLVIVGLLTVIGIGIGLYFWIYKKLKSWLISILSKGYSNHLTARMITTRTHEGKYRKSGYLSWSFGGKNGGKNDWVCKFFNNINISGSRHLHHSSTTSCFKLPHN